MRKAAGIGVALACCVIAGPPDLVALTTTTQLGSDVQTATRGERISLDLKGVDILDVLKLLSQKSGLNFVAGRNVSGHVTIFVKDVDVWEAFERIIDANELAYERQGDIVTVMSARDYELIYGERFQERKQRRVLPLHYSRAAQVASALTQLKSSVGQVIVDEASNTLIVNDVPARLKEMVGILEHLDRPTETQVYAFDYVEAKQFQEKVQSLLSPVGEMTIDSRTNTAVVTDLAEVLEKIDRLVDAFDTPDGQVLIESKIVKVKLTDEMDLGVDWKALLGGVDMTLASSFDVVSGDIVGGSASGGAVKILSSNSGAKLIIEALKSVTDTETLSSPRIMVANRQEARILVGTREAFVTTTTTVPATGSTVSSPEIQFVDVGTKLYVTPQIKRDGYVQLKIRPEVSSATTVTFKDNRIPIVTSTEAETTVLVQSGVTVIIGGLMEQTATRTNTRVPWLGDLPLVGAPFRGTTDKVEKTELVVFLTPEIVLPDGTTYVPPPRQARQRSPTRRVSRRESSRSLEASEPPSASAVSLETSLPTLDLDEEPMVPSDYRQAVRQHLHGRLAQEFRFAEVGQGSVVVSFVLDRDGLLIGSPVIASPQGEAFIEAAKRAVERSQPFPPFPADFGRDQVRFRLAVENHPAS